MMHLSHQQCLNLTRYAPFERMSVGCKNNLALLLSNTSRGGGGDSSSKGSKLVLVRIGNEESVNNNLSVVDFQTKLCRVRNISFNPFNESHFVYSSNKYQIEVVDCYNGLSRCSVSFKAHCRQITDLAWSSTDPNILASSSLDGFINIWDIRDPLKPVSQIFANICSSKLKWLPIHHSSSCSSIALDPSCVILSVEDGSIILHDIRSIGGKNRKKNSQHLQRLNIVSDNPQQSMYKNTSKPLANCGSQILDFDVKFCETSSDSLTSSSPSMRIVTTNQDRSVKLWTLNSSNPSSSQSQELVCSSTTHLELEDEQLMTKVAFTPFGDGFATIKHCSNKTNDSVMSACESGQVMLWNCSKLDHPIHTFRQQQSTSTNIVNTTVNRKTIASHHLRFSPTVDFSFCCYGSGKQPSEDNYKLATLTSDGMFSVCPVSNYLVEMMMMPPSVTDICEEDTGDVRNKDLDSIHEGDDLTDDHPNNVIDDVVVSCESVSDEKIEEGGRSEDESSSHTFEDVGVYSAPISLTGGAISAKNADDVEKEEIDNTLSRNSRSMTPPSNATTTTDNTSCPDSLLDSPSRRVFDNNGMNFVTSDEESSNSKHDSYGESSATMESMNTCESKKFSSSWSNLIDTDALVGQQKSKSLNNIVSMHLESEDVLKVQMRTTLWLLNVCLRLVSPNTDEILDTSNSTPSQLHHIPVPQISLLYKRATTTSGEERNSSFLKLDDTLKASSTQELYGINNNLKALTTLFSFQSRLGRILEKSWWKSRTQKQQITTMTGYVKNHQQLSVNSNIQKCMENFMRRLDVEIQNLVSEEQFMVANTTKGGGGMVTSASHGDIVGGPSETNNRDVLLGSEMEEFVTSPLKLVLPSTRKDANVPFPRSCGASFCGLGQIVTFAKFRQQINAGNVDGMTLKPSSTPRSISSLTSMNKTSTSVISQSISHRKVSDVSTCCPQNSHLSTTIFIQNLAHSIVLPFSDTLAEQYVIGGETMDKEEQNSSLASRAYRNLGVSFAYSKAKTPPFSVVYPELMSEIIKTWEILAFAVRPVQFSDKLDPLYSSFFSKGKCSDCTSQFEKCECPWSETMKVHLVSSSEDDGGDWRRVNLRLHQSHNQDDWFACHPFGRGLLERRILYHLSVGDYQTVATIFFIIDDIVLVNDSNRVNMDHNPSTANRLSSKSQNLKKNLLFSANTLKQQRNAVVFSPTHNDHSKQLEQRVLNRVHCSKSESDHHYQNKNSRYYSNKTTKEYNNNSEDDEFDDDETECCFTSDEEEFVGCSVSSSTSSNNSVTSYSMDHGGRHVVTAAKVASNTNSPMLLSAMSRVQREMILHLYHQRPSSRLSNCDSSSYYSRYAGGGGGGVVGNGIASTALLCGKWAPGRVRRRKCPSDPSLSHPAPPQNVGEDSGGDASTTRAPKSFTDHHIHSTLPSELDFPKGLLQTVPNEDDLHIFKHSVQKWYTDYLFQAGHILKSVEYKKRLLASWRASFRGKSRVVKRSTTTTVLGYDQEEDHYDHEMILREYESKRVASVINCAICNVSVRRGVVTVCGKCGHGGHESHLIHWFQTSSICPAACGCICMQ